MKQQIPLLKKLMTQIPIWTNKMGKFQMERLKKDSKMTMLIMKRKRLQQMKNRRINQLHQLHLHRLLLMLKNLKNHSKISLIQSTTIQIYMLQGRSPREQFQDKTQKKQLRFKNELGKKTLQQLNRKVNHKMDKVRHSKKHLQNL